METPILPYRYSDPNSADATYKGRNPHLYKPGKNPAGEKPGQRRGEMQKSLSYKPYTLFQPAQNRNNQPQKTQQPTQQPTEARQRKRAYNGSYRDYSTIRIHYFIPNYYSPLRWKAEHSTSEGCGRSGPQQDFAGGLRERKEKLPNAWMTVVRHPNSISTLLSLLHLNYTQLCCNP